MKKFTWEELAQHNSRSDALISVRGKVRGQLVESCRIHLWM